MKDKKIAFAQAFASHMATLSNEQQEAFTRNSYIDTRQVADRARAALLSGLGDKESVSRKTLWEGLVMAFYRCTECDTLLDKDWNPCEEHPHRPGELVCPECIIELPEAKKEFTAEQSAIISKLEAYIDD